MKRLSEFESFDKQMEIAGQLFSPMLKLATNKEFRELKKNGFTLAEMAKTLAKCDPETLVEVFAILSEQTVEEYKEKSTTATFIWDLNTMISDTELLELFGVQLQTTDNASSGAATENTGADKK